jgi:hypothetical protein
VCLSFGFEIPEQMPVALNELDGLVTREMEGHTVILPIWHMVSKNQLLPN